MNISLGYIVRLVDDSDSKRYSCAQQVWMTTSSSFEVVEDAFNLPMIVVSMTDIPNSQRYLFDVGLVVPGHEGVLSVRARVCDDSYLQFDDAPIVFEVIYPPPSGEQRSHDE